MKDAISRQAAIELASGACHPANLATELGKLPTVEPERQKGKWIKWGAEVKCSQCNLCNPVEKPFCPNCGADMRGEQNG